MRPARVQRQRPPGGVEVCDQHAPAGLGHPVHLTQRVLSLPRRDVVHRQRAGDHVKRRIRQVQVLRGAHALRYDTEAREKLSDRVSAARPGVTVPAQPKIVADDFVCSGRCPPGTLDQHFFAGQLCKFPDPDDAPKRKAGLGKACLCQEHSHLLPLGGAGQGGVHRGLPADMPLNGLFWTAHITSYLSDVDAVGNSARPRPGSRHCRSQVGQTG
jgi:hypothetical protein